MSFVLGFVLWSFLEYWIHRIILHRLRPEWHLGHHDNPSDDSQGLPYWITNTTAALILGVGAFTNFLFCLGFVVSFYLYQLIHYWCHHKAPTGFWLRHLRKIHGRHHQFDDKNFGVVTPLWDFVFRTYK